MSIENEGLRGLGSIAPDIAGGTVRRGRTESPQRRQPGVSEETGTFRRLAPVNNRLESEASARELLSALQGSIAADPFGSLALQADGLNADSVNVLNW